MSQRSRFFDSVASDRVYTSDAWAQVVAALSADGVVGTGNELAVSEQSPAAMGIRVNTGLALVLGYYFEVYSAQESLDIDAADATNPRIDRVVIRRSLANREATLAILKGTAAASPTAPALTQTVAGTYEISLAQVRVDALASSIVNANITDERGTRAAGYDVTAALNGTTGHAHDGTNGQGPAIAYSAIASKPSTFAPSVHAHQGAGSGGTIAYADIASKPSSFAPSDHAHTSTPGDGGLVSYGSITGKPSSFTPAAHAIDPASGFHTGSLPWGSVSGKPSTFAPSAHASSHANGGSDPVTVTYTQLTGKPSTFAPSAHATSHNNGGSDAIAIAWGQITSGIPNLGKISDATAGDTGVTIFVQTAAPAGMVDGDVWIKG